MLVRIQYLPPGFMASDARVVFRVDGRPVAEGSMLTDVWGELQLEPGPHQLHGTLVSGFGSRQKEWTFDVPANPSLPLTEPTTYREGMPQPRLDVLVTYSRAWGTFAKQLELRERDSTEPAESATSAEPEMVADDAPVRVTWVLVAALVLVFALEHVAAVSPATNTAPSIATLLGLGGLDVPTTMAGQWFRVIACTFLHADVLHLLCNGIAIVMAGFLIERRLGWRWLLALYLVGGVGGSLGSMASNDGHTISVGASGAAMALFGAGLFVAQTLPQTFRMGQQLALVRVLVPSLVPAFATTGGARVDFGAHLGGTVTGLGLGVLLLFAYRRAERHHAGIERFRRSAIALVALAPFVVALPATAYGVTTVAYPAAREEAAARAALLPDAELDSAVPSADKTAQWVQRYPDDPRGLLYAAYEADKNADAEAAIAYAERATRNLPRFSRLFPEQSVAELQRSAVEIAARARLSRRLLPFQELDLPADALMNKWAVNEAEWLLRYPDDPRVLLSHAQRLLSGGKAAEAEIVLEHALAVLPQFTSILSESDLTWRTRLLQALTWRELKQEQRASAELARLCAGELGAPAAEVVATAQLCAR